MKKIVLVLASVLFMVSCAESPKVSDQKVYYHKIVKELSSDEYYGRSLYKDGDVKAARYIIGELRELGVSAPPAATKEEVGLKPPYKSEISPCGTARWSEGTAEELAYLQHFSYPMNVLWGDMEVVVDGKELVATVDYVAKEFSAGAHGTFDVTYLDNKYLTSEGFVKYVDSGRFKDKFVVIDWDAYQEKLEFHPYERYMPYLVPLKNVGGIILKSSSDHLFPYFKARSYYTANVPVLLTTSQFPSDAKKIEVNIDNEMIPVKDAHNIMAYIPGTKNPEKCLMLSSHYDHLGLMGRDNLFNGANDDASGVAMMLALAKYYQENRPEYSVMFLFTDAEEENLLGAFYYAENPRIPLDNVFAYVEIDMIADNANHLTYQISENAQSVMELFQEANRELPVPFEAINPEGLNDDSDHYAFAQKNVPVFYMSVDGDYHDYYHTPRDTYQNFCDENFERFYGMLVGFSSKASSLYQR